MESRETIDLDFHKFWYIFQRRWLPATAIFNCVVVAFIGIAFVQKGSFQSEGKILIKKNNQTSALTGLTEIGQLEGLDLKSSPISTEIEVIRSIPLLEKTIALLNLKDDKGKSIKAEELAKSIKFKAIPSTDVIQINYEGNNPKEVGTVVEQLMKLYIENNIISNKTATTAAGDFIARQLPIIEGKVRQSEIAMRRFKERNQIVVLDEESKTAVAILKELDGKIYDAQAGLADANTRSQSLREKIGMSSQEATQVDSLNRSTGVQKVLEEYQQVENQLAAEQSRFLPTHPTIKNLQNKRDALKNLLDQRVEDSLGNGKIVTNENLQSGIIKQQLSLDLVKSEVESSALISRLQELSATQIAYKNRLNVLPKLEQEQRELQRRLEASQSTYQTLLKKLQEVRVAENQTTGNARIIQDAFVSPKPMASQKFIILALGSFLGILLATGAIVILEIRDKSIKHLQDAKEVFGFTLLGVIPSLTKKALGKSQDSEWGIPQLVVKDAPRLPVAQAYQMLQANLKFLSSDKPPSVIVVTSSVPQEGKSTISANLATSMAQLGKRVLLVDADMHHSSQHHIWSLTNVAGLSDVLVGQAEFNTTVNEVMPNLNVLSAGAIPPNPLALLDSKHMAALIEQFAATYDCVIIDAPPVTLGADALTLGQMADGVLLVTRPGVVSFNSANTAKESLMRSQQNVLGIVVNGIVVENETDSSFYYAQEYSEQRVSRPKIGIRE
jgi:capsular exopolysaccharide synthesis family protein